MDVRKLANTRYGELEKAGSRWEEDRANGVNWTKREANKTEEQLEKAKGAERRQDMIAGPDGSSKNSCRKSEGIKKPAKQGMRNG